jgi:hypothetical protein
VVIHRQVLGWAEKRRRLDLSPNLVADPGPAAVQQAAQLPDFYCHL